MDRGVWLRFATDSSKQKCEAHSVGVLVKRAYITAARLEQIRQRLTARQLGVLEDVGRLRLVSGRQLTELHYGSTESDRRLARRELSGLVDARVLLRDERRVGGVRAGSAGFIYGLDVAGQRLLAPAGRRWWPSPNTGELFARHTLVVSQLYLDLRTAERAGGFELVRFEAEPACWRSFTGSGGSRVVLKPDAYIMTTTDKFEDHLFVELDLGSETRPRLVDKARRYVDYFQTGTEQERHGVFPQTVWLVPSARRAELVTDALSRLDPGSWLLFSVTTIERAVTELAGSTPEGGP